MEMKQALRYEARCRNEIAVSRHLTSLHRIRYTLLALLTLARAAHHQLPP
jgi:hypothetical protein